MFYNRFESLCAQRGVTPSKAAIEAGVNKSAVTYWKTHKDARPTGQIAERLCAYFNVTMSELYGDTAQKETALPPLNQRDERDIEKRLQAMLGELDGPDAGSLRYSGEPLDEETRELLRISLRNQLELSKQLAKKKFTPKKYRREGE